MMILHHHPHQMIHLHLPLMNLQYQRPKGLKRIKKNVKNDFDSILYVFVNENIRNNKINLQIAMYRGTPYLNRQIKRREQQRSMEYHISNLTHIRPRTGTIQYPNQVHINNRKGQMQKEARFTEIQRQNRILLEKISSIMGKQSRKGSSQQKMNRSLNSELRKRQLQNIEVQNAKLLKRLQQRKPNYQTQKFKESWRKQKYVIKNMSNYPFIINDRKRKRSSVSQIGGKEHNPNTIELCRMRIIDGVSFLITIRLNQQRMQIIGDTKDKREIKVIQIDRDEAIQFIQQECQGKIQKIFDCLRYDKSDEVLYLVANEVEIQDVKNQATMRMKKNSKRDDNPEFDFSQDIPIRVNNQQENKLWVEVDPKKAQMKQKIEQKKRENTVKKSEQSMNYEQSGQNIEQKSQEWRKKQIRIQEASQKSKKVESSVNTYEKIKKRSQQSQKEEQEEPKLGQKIESNQIDSSINKESQKMENEYKQDLAIEQPGQQDNKQEKNQTKVEKSKQIGQSDKQANQQQAHGKKDIEDQYQIDQQQQLGEQKEEGKEDQEKGQREQYEEQFVEDEFGQNEEEMKEEEIKEAEAN